MKFFFVTFILFFALFLETATISIPLVLLSLILFAILFEERWIFIAGFFAGILLDILSLKIVGVSSIFFLITLGGIFLYKRKYEIQSIPFIVIFSFLATLGYGFIFHQPQVVGKAFVSAMLAGGVFFVATKVNNKTRVNKTFFAL